MGTPGGASSSVYVLHAPPLRWRNWDETVVVHHDASGSTHFLDALSGAVLRRLESGPARLPELSERISGELDLPRGGELDKRIVFVLEEFDRLGLVERVR